MPGLLDFAQQAGEQAEGLSDAATRAQGSVFSQRFAEKKAAQQGLGQLVGTGLGYAATKRTTQPKQDTTALSQILGQLGTSLMTHWMPEHGVQTEYNPPIDWGSGSATPQDGAQ